MKTRISILFLFILHSLMSLSGTMRVNKFHSTSGIDDTIVASVEIALQDLKEDELNIHIDNQEYTLYLSYLENRSDMDWGVIFQNDSMLLSISVYYDQLSGTLRGTNYIYSMSKDSMGNIYMYELDMYSTPDDGLPVISSDSSVIPAQHRSNSQDTTIRVAVFYTSNISNSFKQNLITDVGNAILNSNASFANSNIHAKLQLVYIGETPYKSDNFYTDLDRFKEKDDGYMDEIHQIREIYYADICLLLTACTDYCGLSYVRATKNRAFCSVSAMSDCFAKYSFTHEIGHIIGCYHDEYVDTNTTPKYAHGYVHLDGGNSWRTLMAYSDLCDDNHCKCSRKLYWSNPNVTYNGIATGNNKANNARVWNERVGIVSDFYGIPATYFLTNALFNSADYANIIGSDFVYTYGQCSISSGVTVDINAKEKIVFGSGFHAKSGSKLHVKVLKHTATLSTMHFASQRLAPYSSSAPMDDNTEPTDEVTTSNSLENIESDMIQSTAIYTISGQLLHTIESGQRDAAHLPSGMYILQHRMSDGSIISTKIIR